MYYLVQLAPQSRKIVETDEDFKNALNKARAISARSGMAVEVLNEYFKPVNQVHEWRA